MRLPDRFRGEAASPAHCAEGRPVSRDSRGVPVSRADAAALAGYEAALAQFQSYVGDPLATIDAALAAAPDFVMGHVLRALVAFTLSEKALMPAVAAAVARAERLGRHGQRARARAHRRGAQAPRRRLERRLPRPRSRAGRPPARRPRAAGRPSHGFLSRRRAEPAQSRGARAAGVGRGRSRLLVRARHARVRAGGNEPVRRSGSSGAGGARARATRRLGGARGHARDGDAGAHRRGRRVAHFARGRLVARQRLRVPQLVASRAVPPRWRRPRGRARALRRAHPPGARPVRPDDGGRDRAAVAAVPRGRRRRVALRRAGGRMGGAAGGRPRLLRVQRRARRARLRRHRTRRRARAAAGGPRGGRRGEQRQRGDVARGRAAGGDGHRGVRSRPLRRGARAPRAGARHRASLRRKPRAARPPHADHDRGGPARRARARARDTSSRSAWCIGRTAAGAVAWPSARRRTALPH